MAEDILLGIDVGTSGCKIAAFSVDGKLYGSATETYEVKRRTALEAEQNAEDWWTAACKGIRSLIAKGVVAPKRVLAIGVVGQSWATLPVNGSGEPLRPAMLWLDRRAGIECAEIERSIGQDYVFQVSGNRIDPSYCIPKMFWIRKHEPEVYTRTYKFLQSNSFVVYKLTGNFTQDVSQGYGYYVFDLQKRDWSEEALERFGIPRALLPEVYEADTVVGETTSRAAEETGLVPGIPVIAGGVDCAAACLGAGLTEDLETQEQAGQAGGMTICTARPQRDPRLISGCHVVRNRWHLSGGTVSGGVLKWFYDILAAGISRFDDLIGKQNPFEFLSLEAEKAPPGAHGLVFLPYMAGERTPIWDANARGVFLGLSYEKCRADLARALMEGAAFALRHNLEVAGELVGKPKALVSVGGGARSPVWCQIKADVTQIPVGVPEMDDGTVFGAAVLAGLGVGALSDDHAALKAMVKIGRWYEPRPELKGLYDDLYAIYLESYNALRGSLKKLADISG